MENHRTFSIDDLVRTKLSYTGAIEEKQEIAVGVPTLDTPATDNVNPMEWLTNPVGLDITPRYNGTWAESGSIVSPLTKLHATALA
jgi:hypothetical protein